MTRPNNFVTGDPMSPCEFLIYNFSVLASTVVGNHIKTGGHILFDMTTRLEVI